MTGAEAETEEGEAVEATEDAAEEQASGDEEMPEVEDDEKADLEAISEAVQSETPTPDESADDGESSAESADSATEALAEDADGDTVGDWYVETLTGVSNTLIEERGRDGAEELDESFARQLNLDSAVNELIDENGTPDMPPEHQVLLGTGLFFLAVAGWKTDLLDELLADADLSI